MKHPTALIARALRCVQEDELDHCVTVFKLHAAQERIRAREGRGEVRKAFFGTPAEKKPLTRILDLRTADEDRCRLDPATIDEQRRFDRRST